MQTVLKTTEETVIDIGVSLTRLALDKILISYLPLGCLFYDFHPENAFTVGYVYLGLFIFSLNRGKKVVCYFFIESPPEIRIYNFLGRHFLTPFYANPFRNHHVRIVSISLPLSDLWALRFRSLLETDYGLSGTNSPYIFIISVHSSVTKLCVK